MLLSLGLGLVGCGLPGSSALSAEDRQKAVEQHLSRYVALKGGSDTEMQLAPQMAALHVPAVSMAAIRDGRVDWVGSYGVSSLGGEPVTAKTLFGAASISKPVTAMGVLRLAEEHRIDLDRDVNQYLKRWKIPENEFTREKKVTVRELLNHTSGIGTHNGEIYDPALSMPTLVQMLDGEKPAKTPAVRAEAVPGTKFAYSNGGYMVLYLLVEDVSGEPFARYMKRAVLDPMGMKDSTFEAPLPAKWAARAATAYWDDGNTGVPPDKFVEPNLAAGGLWTTAGDLARFLIECQREYVGSSHQVLDQRTMRLIAEKGLGPWGLGFRVGGEAGDLYLSHEGSAFFQNQMVVYFDGDGLVVMTSGGKGGKLADELLRSAAKVYRLPDFRAVERTAVPVAASVLASYVGTYGFVRVALEGEYLTAEIPAGSAAVRLYADSATHFFVLDGPQELSFHVEDGVVGVEFITPLNRIALKRGMGK